MKCEHPQCKNTAEFDLDSYPRCRLCYWFRYRRKCGCEGAKA